MAIKKRLFTGNTLEEFMYPLQEVMGQGFVI